MLVAGETEAALVARWGAGELTGRWLRTAAGDEVAVLFPGRPGGPVGPDFRDAVLLRRDGSRLYGDVELHVRAGGWRAHGHDRDARYDSVVLHVVARADGASVTPLPSGRWAALVELGRLNQPGGPGAAPHTNGPVVWPCDGLEARLGAACVRALLWASGDARFAGHAAAFAAALAAAEHGPDLSGQPTTDLGNVAALDGAGYPMGGESATDALATKSEAAPTPGWTAADRVLCVALAEGLAYGRERGPLLRAGAWLAAGGAPDALLRELPRLPALDALRLEGLLALHARWAACGPWAPLRAALDVEDPAGVVRALVAALGVSGGAVSLGRAAILAANVALPFAAAWAGCHDDPGLAARARAVYAALPGLPSNQITRAMMRQLGLRRQPAGARAQQGLHHLWAQHCRAKQCAGCPCARGQGVPR
jgi:hypothetical protein